MVVFFSDLDNTLIFSHRQNVKEEKIVAELLNEKHQSYMLIRVLDYLKKQNSIQLLPVTTRTVEQYSRIHILGEQLGVKKALVCNGGILLDDGVIDETWRHETYSICESNNELSEIDRLWQLVNDKYIDEKGAFDISKCDLIAYANGGYYKLDKKIGKFGYSVQKKQKKSGKN